MANLLIHRCIINKKPREEKIMICYGDKNADNNEIFFFDFTGEDEKTLFTDYHQMKKDIKLIVGTDGRCKGEIGEEKQRKKISTIIEGVS